MWYKHNFRVEGTRIFPMDMLCRDGCFPATEADSQLITADDHPGIREIWLTAYNQHKGWAPMHSRWEAVGWEVREWETQRA